MKKTIVKLGKILLITAVAFMLVIASIIGGFGIYYKIKNNEFQKYGGHGFAYMHGYSSTDFTGYHVYDGEKLAVPDHEPDFIIETVEDMPVMDGAEACYPLYSAFAKALYRDIDKIESEVQAYTDMKTTEWNEMMASLYVNGRVVSFTNTIRGYERLVDGDADLFIGAKPSRQQKEYAKENHDEIISIPIGREAFVFFVEADNPIDNLSSEELRKIYSGEISNWKELGGNNQKIIAFQRPENSGSQVMMEYFMGDVPLKEAETIEMVSSMGGVIRSVKQYHSEEGAIAYTFRYFLEELNQEEGVKILSIDGIYPNIDNIGNGSYPLLCDLVVSKMRSNDKENVDRVIDYMLSDDGQEIVRKTGYGPLR